MYFHELPDQKENTLFLSFDDGYLDNWIYVFPMLKKFKYKATIFVSPEFVDPRPIVRPTLEDYWNDKKSLAEIDNWGFLSWDARELECYKFCANFVQISPPPLYGSAALIGLIGLRRPFWTPPPFTGLRRPYRAPPPL